MKMHVVVVRGRDDRADDQVDDPEQPDPWSSYGSRWVVRHQGSLLFIGCKQKTAR
jgi:hypothetical protein